MRKRIGRDNKFFRTAENIIFLSHFIESGTPLYSGRGRIEIAQARSIKMGDACNTQTIKFPNHASTHIDLPYHFLEDGKTLSDFPAGFWVFNKVQLIAMHLGCRKKIAELSLRNPDPKAELLLIKTGFEEKRSEGVYYRDYPYFDPQLARYLVKKMPYLRAVGLDCISISSPKHRKDGREAHHEFLKRGIILVEDMKLGQLERSPDRVVVSPLLIRNADGVPATVLAIKSDREAGI